MGMGSSPVVRPERRPGESPDEPHVRRRAMRSPRQHHSPLGERERGSVAVEAALLTPVFLLLIFALMEGSWIIFGDHAIRGSAAAGVRTASALANDPLADYAAVQSVKNGGVDTLGRGKLIRVVIYKANGYGDPPNLTCQGGTAVTGVCNVYDGTDLSKPDTAFGCSTTSSPPSPDRFWCPTSRKTAVTGLQSPPDYIGVWVAVTPPVLEFGCIQSRPNHQRPIGVAGRAKDDRMNLREGEDRGGVVVEFALIVTLLVALALGAIDYGFKWRSASEAVGASRAGARVGAGLGSDPTADRFILSTVRVSLDSVGLLGQLDRIIVYDSNTSNGRPPSTCTSGSPSGKCQVYPAARIPANLATAPFNVTTGCPEFALGSTGHTGWCPNGAPGGPRVEDQRNADYVGVMVILRAPVDHRILGRLIRLAVDHDAHRTGSAMTGPASSHCPARRSGGRPPCHSRQHPIA